MNTKYETIYIKCIYNMKNDVLRETTRTESKNKVLLGKLF